MRSSGGGLQTQVIVSGRSQILLELLRRRIRLVKQGHFLIAAGKSAVQRCHPAAQFIDELRTRPDHALPVMDQLRIPDIQRIRQRRVEADLPQKIISLIDRLVIIRQIMQIDIAQLTQLHVQKTSAHGRPVLDHGKILRRKADHVNLSHDLTGSADRHLIDRRSLRAAGPQVHVNLMVHLLLRINHADMRFIRPETDHLAVLAAAVRFGRRT